MRDLIEGYILEGIDVKKEILRTNILELEIIVKEIINCFKNGNKILLCGNGGSAADSQHFAAELVGRYKLERDSLPAIALTTDTSILTAVGNDYGYEEVFAKQVEGLGRSGDILIGISTSGNSKNILRAYEVAKNNGLLCISFLGKDGGKMVQKSDFSLVIPSHNTPRIQEGHIMIIHIICEILEKELFDKNGNNI